MAVRKTVTLQTIADEVGVTLQTVSKALLGKPGMSERTRHAIVEAARRLGYRSKRQIDSLLVEHILPFPTERRRFVLLHSGASDNYKALLLQGLYERFSEFGHRIEAVALPSCRSDRAMFEWIDAAGLAYADGLFLAPALTPARWEEALLALPAPRILLGYPPPGAKVDSVVWDVYEAMWQSVALLAREGHRNVLYVGDIETRPGFVLRWQAFVHAAARFGMDPAKGRHIVERGVSDWRAALRERLVAEPVTAVICGLDEETDAAYRVCREAGRRVPDDLAMVGFLNEPPKDAVPYRYPRLPIRMTGYRAADRMLWRIANPSLPFEHIRLQSDFFSSNGE